MSRAVPRGKPKWSMGRRQLSQLAIERLISAVVKRIQAPLVLDIQSCSGIDEYRGNRLVRGAPGGRGILSISLQHVHLGCPSAHIDFIDVGASGNQRLDDVGIECVVQESPPFRIAIRRRGASADE
jgi:hypothetical protein